MDNKGKMTSRAASAYTISIVTFLDILGFGRFVETASPEQVLSVLSLLKHHAAPDPQAAVQYEIGFTQFSDSVVRTTNIMSQANMKLPIGVLWGEVFDLLYIQVSLIEHGVLIRGGVTIERIFDSDGFIFGPGLNRAYVLESSVACYPRIVLDACVLPLVHETPLLKFHDHDSRMEEAQIGEMLAQASDGTVFLDYLNGARRNADDVSAWLGLLRKHRQLILDGHGAGSDNRIRAKYRWLAAYHNETVERIGPWLAELGASRRGLTVPVRQIRRPSRRVLAERVHDQGST